MWPKIRLYSLSILGLVVLLAVVVSRQLFYGLSEGVSDFLFVNFVEETKIVVVTIDDSSLRDQGQWPWPRALQAKLLKAIAGQNPQVIGYDVNLVDKTDQDQIFIDTVSQIKQLVVPSYSWHDFEYSGHVEVLMSADGKVRRLPAKKDNQTAFSVVITEFLGQSFSEDFLEINYRFGRNTFPSLSANQVLQGRDLEILQDKIVLVGVIAPDLHDIKDTPLGLMSGVEVHANAIDTIISNRVISFLPIERQLLGAIFLALLPLFLIGIFGLKKGLTIIGFTLVGLILTVAFIFNLYHLMLPILYWVLAIALGTSTAVVTKTVLISSQQRFLKKAFSQYVSGHVLHEILHDNKKLSLKGKTLDITVLFLDIRGFTSFSETKKPIEVVDKLNQLLSIVTEVILDNDGTVDKYIGDAVMAFWGAPLKDKKQATHACQAALEIRRRINCETNFKIGIGINYGEAVVGNVGSVQRFDYTAIGDTINLGARLESATKELKVEILVSQAVVDKLSQEKFQSNFGLNKLQSIKVKGRSRKVQVYKLFLK